MSEFELGCSLRLKPSTAELDMFTESNLGEPGQTEPYEFGKAPADAVAAMLTSASLIGHHI